jgi:hypothetical protein
MVKLKEGRFYKYDNLHKDLKYSSIRLSGIILRTEWFMFEVKEAHPSGIHIEIVINQGCKVLPGTEHCTMYTMYNSFDRYIINNCKEVSKNNLSLYRAVYA